MINGTPQQGPGPELNASMIATLQDILRQAQNGELTDMVLIGIGPAARAAFACNVMHPDQMPRMIGEITTLSSSMQNMLIQQRQAQQAQEAARVSRLVVARDMPGHFRD